MPKWLEILARLGPSILLFTPAAPLAPFVLAGIQVAEQIPGAAGPVKKALAIQIAQLSAQAANTAAGKPATDPVVVGETVGSAIDTVIGVINTVHQAHQPAL